MNSARNSKPVKKKLFPNFAYDFVRITGAIPAFLWLRPKVYRPYGNKNPKGAVLFSVNHVSMKDPITVHLVFYNRRMCSLATKDMFKGKLSSTFFHMMHCIKVDKDNFSLSAFREVTDHLEDGKGALVFPEGQINRGDDMLSFKSGIVLMAYKAKAKILPVYIVPHRKWYQRQRVVVGNLIDVKELLGDTPSMDTFREVSEQIRDQEIALNEYYMSLNQTTEKKADKDN